MKKKIVNNNGITAIYVRRSVADRDNNSLSIEAQKEECIKYIGEDCEYRLYCDNGFSGKDTEHRPAFQQMMSDARDGQISRIIVKKYDRFSRNLRDYLNVSEELDKLGVSVYSLSEPFNTSSKEGRMMRNNLLNFAEFERETIAGRMADAYDTRSRETGFFPGGTLNFGYAPQRMTINGKTGSVIVPAEQAEALKLIFNMYAEPSTSLRGILKYLREHDDVQYRRTDQYGGRKGQFSGNLSVAGFSQMLSNPLYVRADKNVYAYFQTLGYEIIDDVEAYDGVHGIFIHDNADGGKYVKVGYHEGLVDAETWLRVQDKKAHSIKFPSNKKVHSSWLVGLIKCKECGKTVAVDGRVQSGSKTYKYFYDSNWHSVNGCVSRSYPIKPYELEPQILAAMRERIKTLEIARKHKETPDMEAESIKADIIRLDGDIHNLMDRMVNADDVVFEYIQQKIKELHNKKSELERKLQTKARKHKELDTKPLTEPLANWDNLSIQEKHDLVAEMIDVIYISHYNKEIEIIFSI